MNIKIMIVALLIAGFLSVGMFRFLSSELQILVLLTSCVIGLIGVLGKNKLARSDYGVLAAVAVLFLFTVFTTTFAGRSVLVAFYLFASAILYVVLKAALREETAGSVLTVAKSVFIAYAVLLSLSLIASYLILPIRATGLLQDYSQAALFLLIAFGLAYPMLRNHTHFTILSLVLFLGIFTTFSRSVNLLLVVVFVALLIFEARRGKVSTLLKPAAIAIFSVLVVYLYPVLVEKPVVDRGGLSHFSTLNSRTIYWQSAWEAIKEKPLLGHGLGNFEWTGIKEARPFRAVYHAHNDYLQVWHDLGVFWLAFFAFFFFRLLIKYNPLSMVLSTQPPHKLESDLCRYSSWVLLVCFAAYMTINFALYSLPFLVGIVILCSELTRGEESC